MKRSANLLILVVLLVVSALAAQYFRSSPGGGEKPEWTSLRSDMQSGLNLLWGTPNNAVQLVPGEGGPQAYVTAFSPRGTRPQRQEWNFAFLRFLAARHPDVRLTGLFVTEGTTGNRLQELQVQQLSGNQNSKPSAAYHPDFDEQSRAELLRRQFQGNFDEAFGAGHVLVLVDVIMPAGGVLKQEAALEQKRRRPDSNLGASDVPERIPQPTVETWLVVNGDPAPVQMLSQKIGLTSIRLVPLAAQ